MTPISACLTTLGSCVTTATSTERRRPDVGIGQSIGADRSTQQGVHGRKEALSKDEDPIMQGDQRLRREQPICSDSGPAR
jgi:hypothetical protein